MPLKCLGQSSLRAKGLSLFRDDVPDELSLALIGNASGRDVEEREKS